MNAQLKIGVSGHYTLRRIGPDGSVRQTLEFDNLITDTGLDQIFNSPNFAYGFGYYIGNCCVGAGNTPPAYTDTSLVSQIASIYGINGVDRVVSKTYVPGPPAYWRMINTYRFGTGVAAGNIAEVGIFPHNDGRLFSRALVLDGAGNPTTLTVLSDEILDVTYELRFYLDTSDTVGTFTIDGILYDTVLRLCDIDTVPSLENSNHQNQDSNACQITAYSGALQSVTLAPTGSSAFVNAAFSGYTVGNHSVNVAATFDVAQANYASGIKAFTVLGYHHKYQMSFLQRSDPTKGIMKVTGQKLTITFRLAIARYTP